MTNKELENLEQKQDEAEVNLQKAFVAYVKATNDFVKPSPSMFGGLYYGDLFTRVLRMFKNSFPKECPRGDLELLCIGEQLPNGSFMPLYNRAKFKTVLE